MTLGADQKRLAILVGLLVTAAAIYFWPASEDLPADVKAARAGAAAAGGNASAAAGAAAARTSSSPGAQMPNISRAGGANRSQEFRPRIGPGRPGSGSGQAQADRISPDTVDPTLRLDLLARVQQVPLSGGQRSLFDFAAVAAAKPVVQVARVAGDGLKTANISPVPLGPNPLPPPPPPPPPPPITLKFYGFVNAAHSGRKRAFFLDGDEIVVAGEGEVVRRHYKIVRIGVNSAVVEDTDNQNQQTIPLEAEQQG
jgi:hypothetical protein